MLGPTGQGKSTLIRLLLHRREYVVVFATKRRDSTIDALRKQGFTVQPQFRPEVATHIILKPPINPDNDTSQRAEFNRAMTTVFYTGGWCIVWDEAAYLSHFLKLERKMSLLLQQGRSLKISIVTATQRPAFIPLYAYDQPIHYFMWKMRLGNDIARLANSGGLDIAPMAKIIRHLPQHHVLYHNKITEQTLITKPEVHQ